MKRRRNKYGNRKTTFEGIEFDSEKEAIRYRELSLLQKAGKLSNLTLQHVFILAPSVTLSGRRKPPLKYIADFAYYENGQLVVEDSKSAATKKDKAYRIKKHLMKSVHGIEIVEV